MLRKHLGSRLSVVVSALVGLTFAANSAQAETVSAKVVSVIDGDSFNVDLNGTKTKVILYGVDCPELGEAFGPEAKKFTDDVIYGKVISIDVRGKDKLDRLVGVVPVANGTTLNEELVRRGLAWWSDKFAPNEAALKQLHAEAKAARRGLWSAPNPIPPWIFRNGDKNVGAKILTK